MPVDYPLLRTIHRILKQRTDLNGRIERGPRQIALAEFAEKKFGEELAQFKESKKKTHLLADSKQLQLGEREAKIEVLKGKLNMADSNREFQLLRDQIAADEQANSVLSDEIFELLERLDTLESEIKTAEGNLEKAKLETQRVRERVSVDLAALNGQLESVLSELRQNEAQLKGDFAAEYRRLVNVRGEDALAETDMQTCGHCCTRITTQSMNELLLRTPVFCKSCGCLLYTVENQAAIN